MATYINSKNQEVDTSTMADKHLERALQKAYNTNDQRNIEALEQELDNRETNE